MKKSLNILFTLLAISMVLSGCGRFGRPVSNSREQTTVIGPDRYYGNSYEAYSEPLIPRPDSVDTNIYATPINHLTTVHFDFDSSAIKETERYKLEPTVEYLKHNSNNQVLIEGHCDWFGTAEYNLALGERRALSAKTYLLQMGAADNQIVTVSKGSLEATQGLSKAEGIQDRRDEIYKMCK
jgi:outer membrane protein OmpA-like peptidoglycan-associated protein